MSVGEGGNGKQLSAEEGRVTRARASDAFPPRKGASRHNLAFPAGSFGLDWQMLRAYRSFNCIFPGTRAADRAQATLLPQRTTINHGC
jgi:hypothetical protein